MLSFATAILLGGLSGVSACTNTNVLAAATDPGFALRAEVTKSGPNQYNLAPQTDHLSLQPLLTTSTHPAGLCADVLMLTTADPNDSGVGVIFWGNQPTDDDYYFFEIYGDQYRLVHILYSKWYILLQPTKSAAIKAGLNQTNELEVRFTGTGADLWINGSKVNQIVAHPSDTSQVYGAFGESPKKGLATMQVKSLQLLK
jgi:hypothetical protein